MADKKEKRIRYVTPKGIASWPKLRTKETKFNPDGEYMTGVLYKPDDPEFIKLAAFLDGETAKAEEIALAEKNENPKLKKKALVINPPYEDETDKEGEPTGMMIVKFKMPALITRKSDGKTWVLKPAIFDAQKNVIPEDIDIGGGSIIKVAYELSPYFIPGTMACGVKKQLCAVQVFDLKQWTGNNDAGAFGFEEEEGFEIGNSEAEQETKAAGDDF